MLLLEKPYVSDFLEKTAIDLKIPVLKNGHIADITQSQNLYLLAEDEFLSMTEKQNPLKLYCNSENAINWMIENLSHTSIPQYIDFCKDKVKFRQMIKPLYPDFFFREVEFNDIKNLDITSLKKPFIIKPAIGFFSIGVYKVTKDAEWAKIVALLMRDIEMAEGLYPKEVMNSSKFIIEECIDGEEFAIDAYYNSAGEPVILNILKHPFSSDTDVSDRIYYTSKEIILEYLEKCRDTLKKIGTIAGLSNFPIHAEVRIDKEGKVTPIEFNPMRFAGWCVTDIAYFAYGINIYEYYFKNKEPEWNEILQGKDGKVFSLVLIDFPKGLQAENIKSFDYNAISARFSKVLALRKIDFQKYPVFAFLFIETRADSNELEMALKMNYEEYVSKIVK